MEKVIQCPICGDIDHCFEDNQGDYSSFMCFSYDIVIGVSEVQFVDHD